MKARSADFWSGLVLGGLGAYIIVTASRWEYLGQDGPGPGFFPLWYGIAMSALVAAACCFESLKTQTRRSTGRTPPRALATWAAFAAMCAAFKLIGFLPAFALLTFFIVAVMYRRPLKVAAAVSVALSARLLSRVPARARRQAALDGGPLRADAGLRGGAAADEPAVVLRRRGARHGGRRDARASGPPATIAMLLPLTFLMNPASAMIMLAGIYYGAKYGGSTTSILLNVPGESASVVTCLDGYQMARKGRAGAALGIAAIASFIAGTVGVLGLMLIAPPLAKLRSRSARPSISR